MPATPLPAGTLLRDRYEIVETLGQSRVATTYVAKDLRSRRSCVVKELSVSQVIRTSTGAESYSGDFTKLIELFEREARVLANLTHPGVPRLIDHFTEDEAGSARLYTVQERVGGKNLQSLVEGGRHFREDEVVAIGRAVASILAHLHALSPPLVHRDIKPSNIMLSDKGAVHLIDFGAVKTTLEQDDLGGQTVVGTFGFMPIEQYEARALPASDVYALGATLLFLLSHRAPHELPRRGVKLDFRRHVNVSDSLARILERMVEPAPEDRYASGREVREALDRVGDAPRWKTPSVPSRRVVAAAAALVAVLIGVAISWLSVAGPVPFAESPLAEPRAPAEPEPETPGRPPRPVRPVGGELVVNLYRDFRYRPEGFPMSRAVGSSGLGTLAAQPREALIPPRFGTPPSERHFGAFPLGNGQDREVAFVLALVGGTWELHVDQNNDEDLSDDGPPLFNQGTGKLMAASVDVEAEVVSEGGGPTLRPYRLWVWFDRAEERGPIEGRFYATSHYAGEIEVDRRTYSASAFEDSNPDALYRESGLCIDLDGDGKCQEDREVFRDGDVVPFPGAPQTLRSRYP
ncbi:MAG: serine/threonine-protein kinase [Longimicrobiales bacterium]|nr:serine/threonine-protein kinase [Longimicrobiales bacterium]